MMNFKSAKTQFIFFLVCFALFLSFKDRNALFIFATCITVLSSLVVESLFLYFRTKAFQITESSIITGLIIGYVFSSDEAWWKLVLAAALAVASKYLIQIRKKHIFNPAAFGILLATIIFSASTQWKGTYLWYILLPFGLYFAYKFRKMEILIAYAAVSLGFFGIQAALQKVPLTHIFGYFSYFYIFIMVIEPKTTPVKQLGKFLFGALVAGLIFILTAFGARFDVELFSLLALNMTVPMLNKIPDIERS